MSKKLNIAVIIVAGGKGMRLGAEVPKQYLMLGEKTLLRHSIEVFLPVADVVQVVIGEQDCELYDKAIAGLDIAQPVVGGTSRQESVYAGLKAVASVCPDVVLIHDAARPMVSVEVIQRVIDKLAEGAQAVIPAVKVKDTIKQQRGGVVTQTLDREQLVAVQTPQGFAFSTIYDLHQRAEGMEFSDDAGICEDFGVGVATVEGDEANVKITTSHDLDKVNMRDVRVGSGFDVHAFGNAAEHVTLCGVKVPHDRELAGHSDADVGLHALVDALLGSIAAGDIGEHFPPSDLKWKGADSTQFVTHAHSLVKAKGGKVNHVDITLICEAPKVGKYRDEMREAVAQMLELDVGCVSVKATTTEGLGFTGRGEGIASQATVTVSV